MKTTLRRPVVKRCPFRDEVDAGDLVVSVDGPAPELHEVAEAIEAIAFRPISHEDFTVAVAALFPQGTQVVTTWHTGPWTVEVSHEQK